MIRSLGVSYLNPLTGSTVLLQPLLLELSEDDTRDILEKLQQCGSVTVEGARKRCLIFSWAPRTISEEPIQLTTTLFVPVRDLDLTLAFSDICARKPFLESLSEMEITVKEKRYLD